jgi:hypothetical protein
MYALSTKLGELRKGLSQPRVTLWEFVGACLVTGDSLASCPSSRPEEEGNTHGLQEKGSHLMLHRDHLRLPTGLSPLPAFGPFFEALGFAGLSRSCELTAEDV